MAFGVTALFVLAVISQAAGDGSRRWTRPREEACTTPGALREAPSGALSACAASGDGSYSWTPVDGASAWTSASPAAPRASPDCTGSAGQWVCDTTCATNGICLDNGQWLLAQNCTASGLVCLNNICTTGSIDACPTIDRMRCLDSDTYPSLVDCSLYYTCDSSLTGIGDGRVQTCPSGLFYDACLKVCDIAASDTCSWAVSNPCAVPGTIGVAPNNDRLYYVCILNTDNTSYPLWRKCTVGHFSLTTLTCERADEPGCGSGNPTTTTSTEATTPETTTTTTETITETTTTPPPPPTTTTETTSTIPPPFSCSRPGINANPTTNCSFYYCYSDGSFVLVRCADGYHFNEASAACILGQCTP